MSIEDFKNNCELAMEFIESCWDENNNDNLTFGERIVSRLDSLDEDVKEIVLTSIKY